MTKHNLQTVTEVNLLLENAYSGRSSYIPKSITDAKRALQISRDLKDDSLIGRSLNLLGLFYMIISDYQNSNAYSKEAIVYFKTANDEIGIADAKYNIGSVNYKTENYHEGLIYLLDALRIYKKYKDFKNQSKVEKAIGTAYEYIGDESNAFSSYKNAVRYARKVSCIDLESNVFNNLSGLLLKKGKLSIAMHMIEHAIKLKTQSGDLRGYGFAVYGRGKIYLALGELKKAEIDLLDAIATYKKVIEIIGACMAFNKLGKLYYKLGHFKKARKATLEGLELSIAYNITMTKIKGYHLLYRIYKNEGKIKKSFKHLELYLNEKEVIMNTQTQQVMENYNLINKMNVLENEALLQKEKQKIIEKKNEDDQKAVKLKQEFLSVMSHEIRTPLNAMTTIVSILEDQVYDENKKLLKSLQFASKNLINIVNDVLDFTKLDSKKTILEFENTNFNELCYSILNLHIKLANTKSLELHLINEVPKNRNYLLDQTKFTQIISNLISNAIKFTEKGKVVFNLKLEHEDEKFDTILISVKDTGEGISEKGVSEIFNSFSQIKPVMTRKQGGTGLGLAIVKRLVELHQSKILVKSKEQEGSEFYFSIKLEKVKPNIQESKPVYKALKNKFVLLVEDTSLNAILIKKILSKWGITTEHAANGKIAIEFANAKKYDFILMDLHMPEMNGIDATKLIRAQSNLNRNTPIFAITADVMSTKKKEYSNLFNDVLWKPIEIEKLYNALFRDKKSLMLESTNASKIQVPK